MAKKIIKKKKIASKNPPKVKVIKRAKKVIKKKTVKKVAKKKSVKKKNIFQKAKAVIDISKEEFEYFMTKIAAI